MEKKEFKAESKRVLEMMINSIYTNKDIFLRELISNASDAIDKLYYKTLEDPERSFNKSDYYIRIDIDKENRTLTLTDTGIGMKPEDLENNLGVIAKSGSYDFKTSIEKDEDHDIIGQFGVGFYSAFMVANKVQVTSRYDGSEEAYTWESTGVDGFTITPATKDTVGTSIVLSLLPNTDEENFDEYLDEFTIRSIVKKYSNYIRYPIKMMVTKSRLKEGSDSEYENYEVDEVLNSLIPLWRKNKSEVTQEDYEAFYLDKHFGFDKPLRTIHFRADGSLSYKALLYIPTELPYDFYTNQFKKGIELYSNGVLIMEKCEDLIPDYFNFVRGIVDCDDLPLNISRETLQNNRLLLTIAKKVESKIKDELENLLQNERDSYVSFFEKFGKQLKFGVYSDFGAHKDQLVNLLMFYSSKNKALTTLKEYVQNMKEDQKYIYYASGDSYDKLANLPQGEIIRDKDFDIFYLIDDIDEFAIKILTNYEDKEFKSIYQNDLGLDSDELTDEKSPDDPKVENIISAMKEHLGEKVANVRLSERLKDNPVCFSIEGELSIEMEKVFKAMNEDNYLKAQKVLEINKNNKAVHKLFEFYPDNMPQFNLYTDLLYDQAMLIEGLPLEDPVQFSKHISELM